MTGPAMRRLDPCAHPVSSNGRAGTATACGSVFSLQVGDPPSRCAPLDQCEGGADSRPGAIVGQDARPGSVESRLPLSFPAEGRQPNATQFLHLGRSRRPRTEPAFPACASARYQRTRTTCNAANRTQIPMIQLPSVRINLAVCPVRPWSIFALSSPTCFSSSAVKSSGEVCA